VLAAFLFETSAHDPAVLTGAAALVLGLVTTACFLPARSASRLDAASTLRAE
jgi:ABC-type lipoprotein release transport system permease subunit